MQIEIKGEIESRFKDLMKHEGIDEPKELIDNLMLLAEELIDGKNIRTIDTDTYKECMKVLNRS